MRGGYWQSPFIPSRMKVALKDIGYFRCVPCLYFFILSEDREREREKAAEPARVRERERERERGRKESIHSASTRSQERKTRSNTERREAIVSLLSFLVVSWFPFSASGAGGLVVSAGE